MSPNPRRHLWRLALVGAAMLGLLACGQSSCDCVAPLNGPLPAEEQMADAVQVRLTPLAFDFIEGNLADILSMFLEGGLVFEVPHIREEFDAWLFTIVIHICRDGCTLTAQLNEATLTRVAPDVLQLDAAMDLDGTLYLTGDVDCDVPIHMQDKPVAADVQLLIDERDGLLYFDVSGVDITITEDDFELDCSGLLGWIIEALKGTITDMMNDQIAGQLDDALADMLAETTCLACDFYAAGCPAGSTCDGDYCIDDAAGSCRTNPLGLVGTIDLGALLADVVPGMQAELDLHLAAGQQQPAAADPLVVDDGVSLRMQGGADSPRHLCVPAPAPEEIPSNAPPPRLPFTADSTVPGTADSYMAGIGVADAFLDWFMYKAYLSGLLCLSLDTAATDGLLSSGTLAALLGSLNQLTAGRNVPVKLQLRPQHVPGIEIGAGTFTVAPDGSKIIDEPLIALSLPETAMDFYALIDERWVRLVTLTQDIDLLLGMEFLPDNRVLPVFDENSIVMDNVVASNYELLAEDPAALEELVPTLIGLALPMLTDSLGVIELPPLEGFVLDIVAVQGELPREQSPYFDYLGLYANLSLAAAPQPAPRDTRARLVRLHTPLRSRMSIYHPQGPALPSLELAVDAAGRAPAEYSWRLDGGAWSVFQPGPRLLVRSPLLALLGEHRLQVRARSVGDYRSLDPEPAELRVTIAPEDDGLRLAPPPTAAARERFGLARADQALGSDNAAAEPDEATAPQRIGCATGGSGSAPWLLSSLLGLALLRRRRR